jgi:hypothetical protein
MLRAIHISGLMLVSQYARAEGSSIPVRYVAPPGCPEAGTFVDRVLARAPQLRLDLNSSAPHPLAAQIDVAANGSSVGRLEIPGSNGELTVRQVTADSCDSVVSALALIAALAIDPHQTNAAGSASASSMTPQALQAPTADSPGRLLAQGSVETTATQTSPIASGSSSPEAGQHGSWAVGVRANGSVGGAAPRPMGGGLIFIERAAPNDARWNWTARFSVGYASTGAFTVDTGGGGARFSLALARLDGCPTSFSFGPATLAPCVAFEGGELIAQGLAQGSIYSAAIVPELWFAAAVLARLRVRLGDRFLVDLDGGPTFPLVRDSFVFDDPTVLIHQVGPVAATMDLSVAFCFP